MVKSPAWYLRLTHPVTALTLSLLVHSPPSLAINKCLSNDAAHTVIFSDQPCPSDSTAVPFDPKVSPPDDPVSAQQRYLADKRKLEQINRQKAKDDQQLQREMQTFERQKKTSREQQARCKSLDLKRQMAAQHNQEAKRKGDPTQIKKTQYQVQQAEHAYAGHCTTE
ncbi:type IV secretory pathway VirB10-like protein [Oxalobacteraceae bacterium GrIS 2.11]